MTDYANPDHGIAEGDGPLAGHAALEIDKAELVALTDKMAHHVGYVMSDKAPGLDCDSSIISCLDCSGFARYAAAKCSGQKVILPDGSQNQGDYFKAVGLKPSDFASTANHDDILRVCIHRCDDVDPIGHIWFVLNSLTAECWGHHGVGRRAWDTPVLERICSEVYVVC